MGSCPDTVDPGIEEKSSEPITSVTLSIKGLILLLLWEQK